MNLILFADHEIFTISILKSSLSKCKLTRRKKVGFANLGLTPVLLDGADHDLVVKLIATRLIDHNQCLYFEDSTGKVSFFKSYVYSH